MARLGDIASVITKGTTPTSIGYNFVEKGINFIKIESISEDGTFLSDKFSHINHECHNALKRSQLAENDILFSIAGAIGRTALVNKSILPANTNQALAIIRIPKGKIDHSFLLYALNSPHIAKQFEKRKQGVAQLNISLKDISELEVPDFSQEKQKYVVGILDKVSKVIHLRKQQLSKIDQLVKSRFIEMFGDMKTNSALWQIIPLQSIIESCEAGWSGNGSPRVKEEHEIAVLKVSSVTKGYFDANEYKVLDDQENIKKYISPCKWDLLFSRANTKDLVGATAIIYEDYPRLILPDKLWRIRLNVATANIFYVKYALSDEFYREKFSSLSSGTSGSMFNVSLEKFKTLSIPLPPLPLQEEFASFVQKVDKTKSEVKQSLEKLETLKKSLMQEYFG